MNKRELVFFIWFFGFGIICLATGVTLLCNKHTTDHDIFFNSITISCGIFNLVMAATAANKL